MTDNPLLQIPNTPNRAPAFDLIRQEHYLPAVQEAITQARANIEAIKNNPAAPDFETVIVALESASELLGDVCGVFYNQLSCVGGEDLHVLAQEIGPLSAAFSSDVSLDPELFAKVKAVYDRRGTMDLTVEQAMLLEETYEGFVRSGAALDEDKKERLREISQEMSTLSPTFMNNSKQSLEAFEMILDSRDDLAGLPETTVEAAAHAAEEKGHAGKYLFTLDMPSYIPFMKYAQNRELREKMWWARTNIAWKDEYDNSDIIKTVIRLRKERARLLGYDNHADYVLERRMAGSSAHVMEFLGKLKESYKPSAERELAELRAFARTLDGLEDLKQWDTAYYSEKLKEDLFDFSSEDFRPYLPLAQVLEGCFEHFTRLFNLRFEPSAAYPVWHEDVKVFDVYSNDDDSFVGTLYGDFHPRPGKKDGAWKTSYRDQGLHRGTVSRPVVAIVCNFSKPLPGRPSLITHEELTTLFHEMGHAIHALLSNVTYRSLAGTNVKWDFVELPSQVQENWCFEKETLDLFAHHYETGEAIPPALVDKLVQAKNFMIGMFGLRQVSLGILDMAWHTVDPEAIDDIALFEEQATKDCALFPRLGGPMSTSFGHIFAGGYAAGYYSYKWAEVLDADTFEFFKEKGLYDKATARAYKDHILSRGGTQNPNVLYKNFRGREADPDALLRREGLISGKGVAA